MKISSPKSRLKANSTWLLSLCAAAVLAACGGTQDQASMAPQAAAQIATGTTTFQVDGGNAADAATAASVIAQPTFHIAPVLLEAPDATSAAANAAPHSQVVTADLSGIPTRGLTVNVMQQARSGLRPMIAQAANGNVAPMAAGTVVSTYSPAQIRAAYGLPALPVAGATVTAAQAAQLGAGQTIYIVDAMHDPNTAAELTAFNQKFGVSNCTTKAIATNAVLPLAAPSTSTCELSVVYSTATGAMTATAPAYDSGWATEIALDVQWAHAIAPLARIVLIEAPDASINSLVAAVRLANAMGPGVVSMSFGAGEGSWTASVDSAFTGANMTYLAATGDNGAAVSWPSVSANVVGVGGTSLTYSGTGARTETAWSGTGGGTSAYVATPSYQTSAVPGMGAVARRTVADVAMNADPSTGQYVAVIPSGSTTANWVSAGGTSLSTPQWAGIIAIANAMRAQNAKPALGAPHAVLYGQISTVAGTYAAAFSDIKIGSHGTCAACTAKVGYDQLTGLGTPNLNSLLTTLSGVAPAPVAPVVTAATINAQVGTALSFTVNATSANPLTYALTGAPSGMVISSTGAVTWPTPVVGTYSVTVVAKDSKTGLTGQAVYTIVIAPIPAPVVTATSISGKVGTPLAFTATSTAPNPVTYTITGAPAGLTMTSAGAATWATPVVGTYPMTVIAKDTKTGLTGQAIYTITIAALPAPVVAAGNVSAPVGTAFSYTVAVTAPNPVTYTMTGAPAGMTISSTGVLTWATPVLGTYSVTVVAKDSKSGLSGQAVIAITITPVGPVITAPAMVGVAGKAVSTTISISDPGVTSLSISISGAPMGMSFALSGTNITAMWASPITGTYSMKVSVVDSNGRSAQATVPITITAK